MQENDEFDPQAVAGAFRRYRVNIGPHWYPESAARYLSEARDELVRRARRRPEVLGRLRVGFLLTGLADEGWWGLHDLVVSNVSAVDVDVEPHYQDTVWTSFEQTLVDALEVAREDGADWLARAVVRLPLDREGLSSDDEPDLRLGFRESVNVLDLEYTIPDLIELLGLDRETLQLLSLCIWSVWLQSLADHDTHPSNRHVAVYLSAFSHLTSLPPGLGEYLSFRLDPRTDHRGPKGGRPPLRQDDRAERDLEDLKLALAVGHFLEGREHDGTTDEPEAAIQHVAAVERVAEDEVKFAWVRHRRGIETWIRREPTSENMRRIQDLLKRHLSVRYEG